MSGAAPAPANVTEETAEPDTLVLRSRWAAIIGWAWGVAGVVWGFGVVAVIVSEQRIPFDTPLVLVLLGVAYAVGHSTLSLHEDGLDIADGWRSHRVLWATVDRVVIDMTTHRDAPVTLFLRGREHPLRVQASWGLTMHQRAALEGVIEEHAAEHGFAVALRTD